MYDAYTPCEVALRLPVEVTCLAFQGFQYQITGIYNHDCFQNRIKPC